MLPGRDRIVGEHFRGDRLLHGASIYILRCSDGSDYTGLTRRSVDERVSEHAQGIDEGCCTFRRRPVGARGTLLSNRRRGGGRASHQGVVSSEEGSLYLRRLCRTHCTRKTERKTHVGAGMICSGSVLRGRFAAPQRLCWRSSVFWAPWLFVSRDGVEDGEEFAGRGDGDEHFGFACVNEALAKGLEDGVVTAGDEACEKEGGAHGLAASGDHGFALPLAGLAGEWGEPGEACDPLAVEGSEFGQFGDERAGGDRPHARNGGETILLRAPCGRSAHGLLSISASISASSFSSAAIRRAMLLRIRMTATRFSRLRSATIISMIWRRRATRSASSCVASSGSSRKSGLVASTKRAIMPASIGSVFARRPSAWAKWRTCAGLTTTTGSEAPASAATTTVSKPPVASTAIRSGPSVPMRSTNSARPCHRARQ